MSDARTEFGQAVVDVLMNAVREKEAKKNE